MKKCKLILDGKEIDFEISQEQLEQLTKQKKKTGYERVKVGSHFNYIRESGGVDSTKEANYNIDDRLYEIANYYSHYCLCENDERFYRLHRQLKRFAVENRKEEINWIEKNQNRYHIYYDYWTNDLYASENIFIMDFSTIYFDSEETAQKAIELFKDELIWYFTEYKDSL